MNDIFNPKYLTRISGSDFHFSDASCLGKQLLELLDFIESLIPSHNWYLADIDAAPLGEFSIFSEGRLKKIEYPMLKLLCNINQFLSGVLIMVDEKCSEIRNPEVYTEEEEFRVINMSGVILEIRAFDVSYFEIYSKEFNLIKKISDRYNTKVVINKSL